MFRKLIVNDIEAIVNQSNNLAECRRVLSDDSTTLNTYLKTRNQTPTKRRRGSFRLNNKQTSKMLNISFNRVQLNYNFTSKYLGVTLDRTLSFKKRVEDTAERGENSSELNPKVSRGAANAVTLKTATRAITYNTDEYERYYEACDSKTFSARLLNEDNQ